MSTFRLIALGTKLCLIPLLLASCAVNEANSSGAKPSKAKTPAATSANIKKSKSNVRYNPSALINDQYKKHRQLYQQGLYSYGEQRQSIRKQLKSYPLAPYLDYKQLEGQDFLTAFQVNDILNKESGTYISHKVRERWLKQLLAEGRTQDFLRYYNDADASDETKCNYLLTIYHQGKQQQALSQVAPIWLKGKSQADICDSLFSYWRHSIYSNQDLIWQRLHLALQNNDTRLANHISSYLKYPDSSAAFSYINVHDNPDMLYSYINQFAKHPQGKAMISHSLSRLAKKQPLPAANLYKQAQNLNFTDKQIARMSKAFKASADKQLREDLQYQNWSAVYNLAAQLPAFEQKKPKWQYWLGRSLTQLGKPKQARKHYQLAAQERDYYGYLAADKLGLPYQLGHKDSPVSGKAISEMASRPGIQRAIELFRLGEITEARREWNYAKRNFNQQEWLAAAKVAQQSGWHQQAIFTIAKAKFWDDTKLRFPLAHLSQVQQGSKYEGIDSNWIYAIIRQESAFGGTAQSHVGAQGLMQLMPATAKLTARGMGIPYYRDQLHEPSYNIQLGSRYLGKMYQKFNYNRILASAAYNAGPSRVVRWTRESYNTPADIWIEAIPFKETRLYVKNVLMYNVVYALKRGQKVKMLEPSEKFINASG